MSDDSDFDFEKCSFQDVNTCVDTESQSFDVSAGQTWIYPINYPIREYQFNIIQNALYQNTLVSLPTGLGKTFIAAVVMYNFYRWYPTGKILFLAPTRPLVRQQMDACYNITAIPPEVTAELTGNKEKKSRADIWKSKRVFFSTPQVLQNDLETVDDLASSVRCIVFDEAHRTRGNHAYSEVMKKLTQHNNSFRVLALSATPGKDVNDMKEVIENLLISHLEFRTEESKDVQPYVYQRTLETVVVPLDQRMQQIKSAYLEILEHYTRSLIKYKIIQGNYSTLSKGKIFMVLKEFQAKNTGGRHPNYSEIMKNLNVCVTLYHAYELLIRHGLRSFVLFFEEHLDKPLLRGNVTLRQIVEDTKTFLGPLAIAEALPDGTHTDVQGNIQFGHPKFYKLQEILVQHFTENKEATRVIVFFEYRESVKEAYALLLKNHPLIKPRIFLGQGSGVTQRLQLSVVQAFKEGSCNTLLSTSIGEEGLDVGEVDLIVCFDISNKSPIRMIQRMGRTGRKRKGHVIILVTQGKEQQTLEDCLRQKKYLTADISASPALKSILYANCPRMIPDSIIPQCEKVYFTVKKNPTVKKNMNIKDMFRAKYLPTLDDVEEAEEFKPITERLPSSCSYWNMPNPLLIDEDVRKFNFSKKIDKQRKLQVYNEIGHSKDSEMLVSLLHMADCKRFNIPVSQSTLPQKKNLKQGDIRAIFKQSLNTESDLKPSQNLANMTILQTQNILENNITDETFNEIFNYLCIRETSQDTCNICTNLFKCPEIPSISKKADLDDWTPPNLSILYTVTKDMFKNLIGSFASTQKTQVLQLEEDNHTKWDDTFANNKDASFWNKLDISKLIQTKEIQSHSKSDNLVKDNKIASSTSSFSEEEINCILTFFKLTALEDIFENEQTIISKITTPWKNNVIMIESSPESPTLSKGESISQLKSRLIRKNLNETRFKTLSNSSSINLQSFSRGSSSSQSLEDVEKFTKPLKTQKENSVGNEKNDLIDIGDVFDMSMFIDEVQPQKTLSLQNTNRVKNQGGSNEEIEHPLQDNRNLHTSISSQNEANRNHPKPESRRLSAAKVYSDLEDVFSTDDFFDLSDFGLSNVDTKKRKIVRDSVSDIEMNHKKRKQNEELLPTGNKDGQQKSKERFVFHKTSPEKINHISPCYEETLNTEDICDLSIFGLSQDKTAVNVKEKDETASRLVSSKVKLDGTHLREDFKKPFIPSKNQPVRDISKHNSIKNGLNISSEQSQLAITQIIDLINDVDELVDDSNGEKKNCETASNNRGHFEDFLDKMV